MGDLVLWDVAGGVLTLTLNNPERRNAWSHAMEHEYFAALDAATADTAVRAIVVTGSKEGRTFCPGADAARLTAGAADGTALVLAGRRSQHTAIGVPKPMIAAINGACAGIGLVQALSCDLRFLARGARITTAYARIGIPAEYGMSWLLTRLLGTERALDLLLSARPVEGEEALALGLASRLCAPEEVVAEAQAYAAELVARSSPRSMAAIKRQVWGDLSRDYTSANSVWLATMLDYNTADNPDFIEGMRSFNEKRPPRFEPLPADWRIPEIPPFVPQDGM